MIKTLIDRMADNGPDAILVTSEVMRRYLTGFHSTDGILVVTKKGANFFTDSRYIEAAQMRIKDAEVCCVEGSNTYAKLVSEAVKGADTLGFEEDKMSVKSFESWSGILKCKFVPSSELLNELREVKSSEQLEKLRDAQKLTDELFSELVEYVAEGRTEREIAAEIQYRFLKKGAEGMSFPPIVVSGPNSSMPHGVPGDRKLAQGEFVTMDFGCVLDGWCSDMTRTVAIGEASQEMRDVYNTVLQAQLEGIKTAKAGVPGGEVDAAARKIITDAGWGKYFGHSFGHGLGMEVHEQPNASSVNNKPLKAGNVISAEPGIYLPGRFGVRIEDVLIITPHGCEDITHSEKQLLVL